LNYWTPKPPLPHVARGPMAPVETPGVCDGQQLQNPTDVLAGLGLQHRWKWLLIRQKL
jgi:hypothetical protein